MSSKNNKIIISILILLVIAGAGYYWFEKNIGVMNTPDSLDEDEVKIEDGVEVSYLKAPAGMKVTLFAKGLPGARVIELDSKGRMLVSQTSEGKISVVENTQVSTLISGLNKPHGMAMNCASGDCFLYVAEADALSRFPYDADTPSLGKKEKLMTIGSSRTDRHFTRSLLFLPWSPLAPPEAGKPSPNEDTLLISVGSSCDACNEKDTDHASVISYNINTGKKEIYATGLRNAVFMTLNPVSGKVYATEMGRDNLGDNLPPDEINIIEKGGWYGWPWFYGKNIEDMKFSPNARPSFAKEPIPSFIDLPAHSAPLGLAFIPEEGWPEEYWYNLLVAYHGSWNRTEPTGYKIVRLKMNAKGEYLGTEDFISGWLTKEGSKTGRPVDIKVLSGGVAYITDDDLGVVYRLTANK